MEGGTVFHFVTDGIEAALERARDAAGEKAVSIAGGVSVLNQCLAAGLVEELRLHAACLYPGTIVASPAPPGPPRRFTSIAA